MRRERNRWHLMPTIMDSTPSLAQFACPKLTLSGVWTPRCVRALQTGINILNPLHAYPNEPSYEFRLAKYDQRGFAVAMPGWDETRIDYARICQTPLSNLKGLVRLVKISSKNDDCEIQLLRKSFYDNESDGIILPSTIGEGWRFGRSLSIWRGYDRSNDTFPLVDQTWKAQTWAEIEDAIDTIAAVQAVPNRLSEAWDTKKRSREYINAESMDRLDWDSQYYDAAYTQEK